MVSRKEIKTGGKYSLMAKQRGKTGKVLRKVKRPARIGFLGDIQG